MKTSLNSARMFAIVSACALLSSCVAYDDGVYSSGFASGGYYDDESAPYSGGYYPPPYPSAYGSFTTGYYHSGSIHRDDDRREDDHPHGDDGRLDKDNLRITGGHLGSKTQPQGVHSAEWYRDRGYNLNRLKVEDRDGTPYRSSSSRSDSDSHSRSSKSDRDDDKPSRSHSSRGDEGHDGGSKKR